MPSRKSEEEEGKEGDEEQGDEEQGDGEQGDEEEGEEAGEWVWEIEREREDEKGTRWNRKKINRWHELCERKTRLAFFRTFLLSQYIHLHLYTSRH